MKFAATKRATIEICPHAKAVKVEGIWKIVRRDGTAIVGAQSADVGAAWSAALYLLKSERKSA